MKFVVIGIFELEIQGENASDKILLKLSLFIMIKSQNKKKSQCKQQTINLLRK